MTTVTSLLTASQIAQFKEQGYIVVEGLIDEATLAAWRNQYTRDFGPLHEPATWAKIQALGLRNNTSVPRGYRFQPESLEFRNQAGVKAVIDQLGGGQFYCDDDSNAHILWTSDDDWQLPDHGHVDGYAGNMWFSFILGSTTYMFDVEHRGGGTIFWPGSHLVTWRHLQANPDSKSSGDFQRDPAYRAEIAKIEPVEMTAKAGDVIFWHNNLYHSASQNVRTQPRFALFARYFHQEQERIRHDVPADLWQYWGI